ncbi:hypothetical protein [Collimonas silvisoli]|uniref:hypothetical protein n=1 Tax=Collimonas silvisoli TaxID=2825884 RepID=UPI001B8AD0EB|nr:hypothetical protein [Collimonas silvisoli]
MFDSQSRQAVSAQNNSLLFALTCQQGDVRAVKRRPSELDAAVLTRITSGRIEHLAGS